jgi:hypothetical protein
MKGETSMVNGIGDPAAHAWLAPAILRQQYGFWVKELCRVLFASALAVTRLMPELPGLLAPKVFAAILIPASY